MDKPKKGICIDPPYYINPKPKISVCLSTSLLAHYNLTCYTVVVIDVLRASSSLITGLAAGVNKFVVTDTPEECIALKSKGFVAAGERNGKPIEGCDLGNTPTGFKRYRWLHDSKVALTTSNGTKAILLSKDKEAHQVLIGGFLNIDTLANYLNTKRNGLVIACAGWGGKISSEDTLCAGRLISALLPIYRIHEDEALCALNLYNANKNNLPRFLKSCAHIKRLRRLKQTDDIRLCLRESIYEIIPVYQDGYIVPLDIGD